MQCYNTSCSTPTVGVASSTFASAVQYFAAAQCLITEGTYPETDMNFCDKFDFIIVGAGSSGCVLANRLSEVKEWNVLLIEAGGDPPIEATIPYLKENLYEGSYSWNYRPVDDGVNSQGYKNGGMKIPRGKVIGGTSNLNSMAYSKGNDEDFQRWFDAGNEEWSVRDVRRCFKKAENFQDMNLNRIPEIRSYYGHDGPLVINTFNSTYKSLNDKLLTAWDEIGVKSVPDINVANIFGAANYRATASNGERNSVSRAYLQPVKGRTNLKILKDTLVTKVLIHSSKETHGVVVEHNGKLCSIYASKEVIISAGAINSPQLLMLSGIGPQGHLNSKNITTIVNSPMVGQNLKDHFCVPVTIYGNETHTDNQADLRYQEMLYLYNRTGYLGQNDYLMMAVFYALDRAAKYPDFQIYGSRSLKNSSGMRNSLSKIYGYKDEVVDSLVRRNKDYAIFILHISMLHQHSSGNISLSSNNPKDPPLIHPNYFNDPKDMELIQFGIKKLLKILKTSYFRSIGGFLGRLRWPECDKFKLGSQKYWECIIKNFARSGFHHLGTCKMGSDVSNSVVSSRLKVHGVTNLRVVDSSVMPNSISGNINGPCVMIGERAAEIIKEDYKEAN